MLGTIPSIKKHYIPEGNKNRSGYKLEATTLTIHNTANPKSSAQNERDWLVNPSNDRTASWHYCVDEKEAIVAIPETEVAWHAGTREGNYSSLSLEVCESGNQDIVWKNAVGLAASILLQKGWGVDKLKKHRDWSGKNCPRLIIPKWDDFVADVQETINHLTAKPVSKPVQKGTVTAAGLNVRTEPTSKSKSVAVLEKGDTVTILEEKAGWYRIATGKWVSGKYIKKVTVK